MMERAHTNDLHLTNEEPWPATEAPWPNANWLSPWAFDEDDAEPAQAEDIRDRDSPRRH